MMSLKGCGPVAAFILILLILIVIGSNEVVGYYFSHCRGFDVFGCLLSGLEDSEPQGVVATGVYDFKGYSVNITANIPLEGGAVTGSVSGTCEGSIKGTFSGQDRGVISGAMMGACSPFFVNIPASAEFSGSVNKTSKTVPFTFTGKGGGFSHAGSMSLRYP